MRWSLLGIAVCGVLVTSGVGYIKDRFYELLTLRGERTATLQELAQLKQFLSKPQRKAVDKGIVTQATVVRSTVVNRETVHPDGKLCEDWVDPDGRFHWHAESRTLEVSQIFHAETSIIETRSGRLYADTRVTEVSPRTGKDLREVSATTEEILLAGQRRARSRLHLLVGAYSGIDVHGVNRYGPIVRAELRIFSGLVAGAEASSDARLYVGWRKEF